MKPRKPLSLAVAAATLLTASFSLSASAELTDREASIVPIAAFTANGNQEQLKKALAKGLDKGLTVNEIKAVLEQMYAYTGFPRSLTDESIAKISTDLYREGMLYYGRTHRHPNSTFTYTASSLMDLMTWDARDQVELINVPLLMMAGEKADSLYMTEEVFAKATGTKDKELFKIPGATHIQTYYVPEYVNQAVDKLKAFFGRTL